MKSINTTRRAVLAGAATLPALAIPTMAHSGQADDPIFAYIDARRNCSSECYALSEALEAAENAAIARHGHRPCPLVTWRDYFIGGAEIEQRRETLMRAGLDPKVVEREYQNAKARERDNIKAGVKWDEIAGIGALREETHRAWETRREITAAIALIPPKTPAGAGALVALVVEDQEIGEADWHCTALTTAANALRVMSQV